MRRLKLDSARLLRKHQFFGDDRLQFHAFSKGADPRTALTRRQRARGHLRQRVPSDESRSGRALRRCPSRLRPSIVVYLYASTPCETRRMASTTDDEPKANEADNPVADHAIAKQRILIFLLVYDASLAVMRNFMPKDDQVLDYVIGLPVLIPILIWCHLDAKERNHTIGILMKLCLVFFSLSRSQSIPSRLKACAVSRPLPLSRFSPRGPLCYCCCVSSKWTAVR